MLTEQWREHGRLVIVDETGDRLAPLLVAGRDRTGALAIDEHPSFSPDGRWLVFASNRGLDPDRRALWTARAEPDAVPQRLTSASAHEIDPIWTPDGIVFAAVTRFDSMLLRTGRRQFDLYRLPMAGDRLTGGRVQLTDTPEHEVSPSAAGGRLVFQQIHQEGTAQLRSWIAERLTDGSIRALTDGPHDGSPALAPDGRALAYTIPRLGDVDLDLDVVVLDAEGFEQPALGFALSGSSEGAPAWSHDGRWLFVTSVLRSPVPGTAPLLSSVLHRDTWSPEAPPRMLRDTAGAAPRLGVALGPVRLDETALRRNLDHATAVGHALQELAERAAAAKARERR